MRISQNLSQDAPINSAAGLVVLITGGGRGIGAATALLATRAGYQVAISYHRDEAAAKHLEGVARAEGGLITSYHADIGKFRSVERMFSEVDRDFGRLDALVNNAGMSLGRCSLVDLAPSDLERVIAVNLLGTFYCTRAACFRMARSRGGHGGAIVNVSSQAATFGGDRLSAYAASKAGVNAMTIGLSRELAAEGIRVNAISPGVIDTDQQADLTPEQREALLPSLPMGRLGRPEEVAEAILWLLSNKAAYVSGAIMPVAGGR